MKAAGKFFGGLFLFLLAWLLFLPLSLLNFLAVAIKFKDLGYFKSSAVNLDRFGNFEETISSVLGKNQLKGTLTRTGKALVWVLDKIDKNHCKKSIKKIKKRKK